METQLVSKTFIFNLTLRRVTARENFTFNYSHYVLAIRAYGGVRPVVPRIHNLSNAWRSVVRFTIPLSPTLLVQTGKEAGRAPDPDTELLSPRPQSSRERREFLLVLTACVLRYRTSYVVALP
jgi:hypothetical protein